MTDFQFPVEAGHILLFARALGYPDSGCAPAADGSVVAPPTFLQASAQYDPEFPLRPRAGEPWLGSGRTASGVEPMAGGGGLHAEQHFEYHRLLQVGEVLTVSRTEGKTWEKSGRRGGLLRFVETITEYRDATGAPVVTARSVSVVPEHVVANESADAPALAPAETAVSR
ncbi:hypothetical protein CcI49_28730 [Frankia sp. CcI49]|uniref:FAS1-like dehydratase domain-containing protein n=1 Tax=Frankia sp. CcI49 TaxID=1745382 RepID=UPI000977147C|nr:MaoC family dehydratase N-terminal domain-containing protein [Frankia sp. CcI49]ONH55590.1 hypothetical protein CcI49_28730 [Frankia sp. CcI49]